MMELALYEAACVALSEARRVDEVLGIHDEAKARRAYAFQAKDKRALSDATALLLRARRRLGEMMEAQKAAGFLKPGRPWPQNNGVTDTLLKPITLDETGIDKNLAKRAREAAAKSDEEFATFLAKATKRQIDAVEGNRANTTGFKADNEWFTPQEHIELARSVLVEIDLDPASHALAQKTVRAKKFFTKQDDGLTKEWHGRVWLNPPYEQPLIGEFVDKLVCAEKVTEAILLTNNATDSAWFHQASGAASRICFTRGRVRFKSADGATGSPLQGQALFYFGKDPRRFVEVFGRIGEVVCPVRLLGAP